MRLILDYPDYFAAAIPICEALPDDVISDQQLSEIKDLPLYFIYSNDDPSIIPEKFEIPTINRLKNLGATNLHVATFDSVIDTSGKYNDLNDGDPYQYNGHWSWIYFDNNECYDENGVNAWQWLAKQIKTAAPVETPDQPTTPDQPANSVKTGDDVNFAGLGAIMMLTLAGIYVSRRKYN